MPSFILNLKENAIEYLNDYRFKSEGQGIDSLQATLFKYPEVITSIPELELSNAEVVLSFREYSTSRGPIDLLILTSQADIILIETKLIRNPESVRAVVAQVIDYIKALSREDISYFTKKISKRSDNIYLKQDIKGADRLLSLISNNLKTGNFKVLILGDLIHSNLFGIVDSIQSAPHLAFTIFLVELNPITLDQDRVLLSPKVLSNTLEIERSVIRIEISSGDQNVSIESEIPEKNGKGSKPILSWDEYLNNLSKNEFRKILSEFKLDWINKIENSINMGQVGFSAGLTFGNKRIPVQFIYDTSLYLFSAHMKSNYNIPDDAYNRYTEEIKKVPEVYDKCVVGNKVMVPFDDIDETILKLILDAGIKLGMELKSQ